MNLLLDTHIWIWSLLEPQRLTNRVRAALEDGRNHVWLSPVSIWEAALAAGRKRLTVDGDVAEWIERSIRATSPREAPFTYEVALRSVSLKLTTRDPADRFIAATAAVHGLTLVTADKHLTKTKEFSVLAN